MKKSEILLNHIDAFYKVPEHRETLVDIIKQVGGDLSPNLEWFITNYSKKNGLSIHKTVDGKLMNVHCAYKNTLDGYSKKLFDPFCRCDKIVYQIPDTSDEIHTTVAQLNFIKWCIKNDIISYIRDNKTSIFNK